MKHTKEEIIKALNVIRDECNEHSCMDCPFGDTKLVDGNRCKLKRKDPALWTITKEEEHWRALR